MNIKKLFATLAGVSLFAQTVVPSAGVFGATYSQELQDAYNWAYGKGVTTMSTIDNANMYGAITRAEMAKMLSVYATEVLGYEADTSKACNFTDIDSVKGDLHDYIIKSCQLGLMGQGITAFRPYDTISRAEFGTALSRTLWGNQYEGGTPYYANHLNALKAAGIMNQIANAESTKEVRGYVMLMLMRSEGNDAVVDCDDPVIALACNLDSEDCPAACKSDSKDEKDDKDSDEKVRSGDLEVTAKAADGRKALIGWVSDLDTVTFKTSEDVTISSITLERYGYSTKDQVKSVQLEDEDGNIIADAKEINNKGQVKLTLKKDYKTVDGTFRATIVLTTNDLGTGNGSTIGFKVIDADSTAKNLNLDDYNPYTYDLVNYKGSAVEFTTRNSAEKIYNWEAGELYEVAKFRVKSPADATILVKGFTLTDNNKNKIEADKFAKDVTVTVNGKEVSGLKWNINKDDELVVSFSEVEVAAKETATFAVKMSFNEEFDNFGQSAAYYIKKLSNFNAIDKKTETRVSQDETNSIEALATKVGQPNGWTTYIFRWGKVKLSGTKLGTVDAAANSTNVKVAEWEITITEALRGTATIIVASNDIIDEIRLVISGEEYDGSKVSVDAYSATKTYNTWALVTTWGVIYKATAKVTNTAWSASSGSFEKVWVSIYEFKGLEIEKSGTVEVRVDVKDNATNTMTFNSINSSSFDLKYDESGEEVWNQIIGSISISNLKPQAAKASLDKSSSKEAELILNETNRKTIFDGTYTAKNGDVTLKSFIITSVSGTPITSANPTFYVTIDNEEYDADWSAGQAKNDIDDIEVADGKSVKVKVEIDVVPSSTNNGVIYNIKLEGEDKDNNKAWEADEDTVKVKVVSQWSIQVTDASAKKTILLKSNRDVAVFKIKPSKSGDEDVILKSLNFAWYKDATATTSWDLSELKIDIDGDKYTVGGSSAIAGSNWNGTISPDKTIPAEGIVVTVSLKSELADSDATSKRTFKLISINGNSNVATTFSKYYVPAKIENLKQSKNGDSTRYTFDIDNDGSDTVSALYFYTGSITGTGTTANTISGATCEPNAGTAYAAHKDTISENGNSMNALNGDKAENINSVSYKVGSKCVIINKTEFEDFFDLGSEDLMLYSNKSN